MTDWTDNAAVETAVREALRSGPQTFKPLLTALGTSYRRKEREWRAVDKALQRMRKRGAVAFDRKTGWRLT